MNFNLRTPLLAFFSFFFFQFLQGQDALNRSVQVSVAIQENPPRFDFSWEWDWSEGGYQIYKKSPDAPAWGQPMASLPWGATTWSDTSVQAGVPYEYAFYKKGFEKIIRQIEAPAGETLIFSIHNVYGEGLCCNFGFGWYLLQTCGNTVSGGSDFGFEKKDTFNVCNNGNATETVTVAINPDMLTNNTWWTLKNSSGVTLDSSGPLGANLADRPKFGYILAGIKLPPVEKRGSILVLADSNYMLPLAAEIRQLENDLVADGWSVILRNVGRQEPVTAVKSLITNEFNQHSDLKMLYLIGHVPVPYSGDIFPDGHSENHRGAWPADVFYAELDGVWTDVSVSSTTAQFAANQNVPGDGKFDQSAIPGTVELAAGRVDLYDMPAFGNDDVELTRRYLHRAHDFKQALLDVKRRALVDDNLGIVLGSPAASGWRNFAPMFTADSVQALDYFSTMKNESYLWSYGGGSGTHTSANGIGTTQDFVNDTLKNIFTMLLGSQFGDWDNSNNFLRAPLASPGWTLTNCWAGNPPFTFHHMATGEPIGYSVLRTQNSSETNYYPGPQLVHAALMGDPSLRLHPVKPVSQLVSDTTAQTVELAWEAPDGEAVAGYFVYQQDSISGSFFRLNNEPLTLPFFSHTPADGHHIYMVRTLKLENSGSGSYYNLSLGVRDSIDFKKIIVSKTGEQQLEAAAFWVFPNPTGGKIYVKPPAGQLQAHWTGVLLNASGKTVHKLEGNGAVSLDLTKEAAGVYFLKIICGGSVHTFRVVKK